MSDELIGGMIKGAVMAISLSLIGLLLFYVLNIIKKVLFKAKNTVTPLSKAVYNHSKDIVSEIKPAINEYKEKHSSKNDNIEQISKTISASTINDFEINEDEIYEKIMIEIEEDKKVKSSWARALAKSDGDKDKAESEYIKLRLDSLVEENKIFIENEKWKIEEQKLLLKQEEELKQQYSMNKLNSFLSNYSVIGKIKINNSHYKIQLANSPIDIEIVFDNLEWKQVNN